MTTRRVAIAGAGIAGLTLADALRRADGPYGPLEVLLLERAARPGGHIRSDRVDGYLCEDGANGFLDSAPDTLGLIDALGLHDRLVSGSDHARRRYIFRRGRLHQVPGSPLEFLRTGLLSGRGKLRLLAEPFAAGPPGTDESIHGFAARRIGEEAARVFVDAMVSGVFAGDPERLSLRACFPRMWELERCHGGLFRALLAQRRGRQGENGGRGARRRESRGDGLGAPAGRLMSLRGGMAELVNALANRLGASLRVNQRIRAVRPDATRDASRFLLHLEEGPPLEADAVVLAGPASQSAALVRELDPALADELCAIPAAPVIVVCLGYDARALVRARGPLDGFGLLVPGSEALRVRGVLWESSIFPDRAPAGRVLLRAVLGGACDADVMGLDDRELLNLVRRDLRQTMALDLEPELVRIRRHATGIPQYEIGHLARLARIDERLAALPGLFLTGGSYRGVSLNACVADAGAVAAGVLTALHRSSAAAAAGAARVP